MTHYIGKVKWFSNATGYGFLPRTVAAESTAYVTTRQSPGRNNPVQCDVTHVGSLQPEEELRSDLVPLSKNAQVRSKNIA